VRNTAGDAARARRGVAALLGLVGLWAIAMGLSTPARAADDPWSEDVSWVSMRVGSASSGAQFAPPGGFGYGFGYTWFLAHQLAWSATVQHDLLGHFGSAAEMEVPVTVEFTRHFHFSSTSRPYLGAGWGAIYHKTYRTGADASGFRQGVYVAVGGNTMLNDASLIGVDLRLMIEQDTRSINPTFPNIEPSSDNWSIKLSYSRVL
jgi:hypothetical protein